MNNYYLLLIKELKQTIINPAAPIPIELVKELTRLIQDINKIDKPTFIDNEGNSVIDYWEEFKFTGLNNVDYINNEFYKEGWGDFYDKD